MVNGMWPLSHFWKDHGDDHGGGDGDGDDDDDDADDADDADDDDDEGEEEEEASRWHSAGSHQVKMTFRCCHAMPCQAPPFSSSAIGQLSNKTNQKNRGSHGRCAWSNF